MIKIIKKYNIKSILEIGTANSYSSHIFARYGAKVLSLEKNYKMYNLALKNLINSRLNKNIQVLFKDALLYDTNKKFDMIFIDADKRNYQAYYELCLKLISQDGIILFDNVLWSGDVADSTNQEKDTVALRELNQFLFNDNRVNISMIPVGDGITMVQKR